MTGQGSETITESPVRDQAVIDRSDQRKYRIELPNMVDDADLDPYEFRLLAHYKRVGTCTEGTETTAQKCRMSTGKVSEVRQSLADKGWIEMERTAMDGGRYRYRITVIDRWLENYTKYSKMKSPSLHEANPSLHEASPSPRETDPSLHEASPSPRETDPSLHEASPSPREADPSLYEASPSPRDVNPSLHEVNPSLSEARPSPHEASPSLGETNPSPHEGKNKQIKNQPIKNEPIKKERDITQTDFQQVLSALEGLIGAVPLDTARLIDTWLEKHPPGRILQAVGVAREKRARSTKYIDQVLIGWEANGYPPTREQQVLARAFKPAKGQNGTDKPHFTIPEYSEADLAVAAEINRMSALRRAGLVEPRSAGGTP